MDKGVILSPEEIKDIVKDAPKYTHLELYRALKINKFSEKINKKDLENLKKQIIDYFKLPHLPRKLQPKEIDEILNTLPALPSTFKIIAEDNLRQLKNRLRKQLESFKFSVKDGTINKIKKEIKRQYIKSVCAAGENVGVNGALSICQPLQQSTLNSFHKTGTKNNGAGGMDYMRKLFDVSKPDKDVIITHFRDKNLTREEIIILLESLHGITMDKLISKCYIMKELNDEDKIWYENYSIIMGTKLEMKEEINFLRIELDLDMCFQYNIFINDIVKILEKNSRTTEIKQGIKCVAKSTFDGIIDIHIRKEFIQYKYEKEDKNKYNIKDIKDYENIFLSEFYPKNFKDILVKGIKDIDYFDISNAIDMNITYEESPLTNEVVLDKFKKLKMEDVSRLWYIRINKRYLFVEGIGSDKYVKLFEEAGLTILENNIDSINHDLIVMMPEKLDSMYFDKDKEKSFPLYRMNKEGVIYNNKTDEIVTEMGPKKYIVQKIKYIEDILYKQISENLKEAKKVNINYLPIIPPLYRYSYYYYAVIEGKSIIKDLISNSLIDSKFTYPDNVNTVNEIFGIEAARYFLVSKYVDTSTTEKINPVNLEILIDYQTSLGRPLPVTFNGIIKTNSGILSTVSFEKPMPVFQEGAAVGINDKINGISGSIMVGNKGHTGTGVTFSEIKFDEDYLNDKSNLNEYTIKDNKLQLETEYIIGPCYSSAPHDMGNDYGKDDTEDDILFHAPMEGKVSELCLKENIPEPPRMKAPEFLDDLLEPDYEGSFHQDVDNTKAIEEIEDIPDNPGELDLDYF